MWREGTGERGGEDGDDEDRGERPRECGECRCVDEGKKERGSQREFRVG